MEPPENGNESTSVVNPDGAFVENWADKYPEHKATLSRFKNFDDLVNAHMSQRKKFGRNPDSLVQIPKEDSSDEVKAAFHKAGGKPDTVEGYKFEKSPDISDKVEIVDAKIKAFAERAHNKYHLNNAQFNGIVNDYLMDVGADIDAFDTDQSGVEQKATQEGNAVLSKVFKTEAKDRKKRANALLDTYGLEVVSMPDGSDATIKGMLFEENPKLLKSPWMIMFLDAVAQKMSPDTIKGIGSTTVPTSAQVDSKIAEVRSEMAKIAKDNPATYKNDPRFKDLKERKHNLYKSLST